MVKKEISSVQNWKEAFWETALCCVNSSHSVTPFFLLSCLLTLFSWNMQWDIFERIEANGDEGNILRHKLERSFLGNYLMMCEFIPQSYTVLFNEQFANSAFMESTKGYLGEHQSLYWKRKYPQIKTKSKLSEKLLCDVWNHVTELHFSFHWEAS